MNDYAENKSQESIPVSEQEDSVLQALRKIYTVSRGDVGAALRLAQYYVDRGWYNQAIDVFRDSLKENGDDYTLLLEYGNTCFKKGEYHEAGIKFKKLTEIKPDRIEGWNNLGIVQIHEGDLDEAYVCFKRVIAIEPDNTGALLNMGNYHSGKGESEQALEYFRKVAEVSPSFADAWYNLGNVLLSLHRIDEAIEAFEKSIKYKSEFPSALKNLGVAHERNGNMSEAERCYVQAIEFNKADPGLRSNLGAVQLSLNKVDDAKENFLKAVRLSPQETSGWMGLREVALAKGDMQMFTRATLSVLPRLSESVIASSLEILYDLHQVSSADEIVKQVDRLGTSGDALDVQRIIAYFYREGVSERVVAIYKRIASASSQNPSYLKGLARFAFLAQNFENAIEFVNKMEHPDCAAHSILWRSLVALNRETQARRLIQNYIREYPDYFDSWFLLGQMEARRGKRERAERFLIKALENGFTDMEEANQNAVLKQILDSLAENKAQMGGQAERTDLVIEPSDSIS
jgi:tetratricopeptide (TPR) repeat protein